jgi:hypothetical protein
MAILRKQEGKPVATPNPKEFQSKRNQTAPALNSNMDYDAAIRILRAFIRDMTGSSQFGDMLLKKPVRMKDVLEAIDFLPKERLDDRIPTGITIRELLERVTHFALDKTVKDAVGKKIN